MLRITVHSEHRVVFGRYDAGATVIVPQGAYLYIGSAMSRRDPCSLAHRVLRHLTRTPGRPPQRLRTSVLAYLRTHGCPAASIPEAKACHWHIDYLLDRPSAEVMEVVFVRGPGPGEKELVQKLLETGATEPLRPGLGASDHPRHTHLVHWKSDLGGWERFVAGLAQELVKES